MRRFVLNIFAGNTRISVFCGVLSAVFTLLSACADNKADKDISPIIEAWKTADQTQSSACRPFLEEIEQKWEADTTENEEESYLEFLGTLNALRDYAKNNPSTRVEIRNTIYEVYGKMLYGSDKQEYLEAETIGAIRKAVPLNDKTLLAELYKLMADLTANEALRSAIYDTKAIDILTEKDRLEEFYTPDDFAVLSHIFFEAEDYRDAIKYGTLYCELSEGDTAEAAVLDRMTLLDIVGTSYMEINQWDSASATFENMMGFAPDSTLKYSEQTMDDLARLKEVAEGKTGLVQAKWQQFAPAREKTDRYLKNSLREKDTSGIIYSYLASGMIYSGQGDAKKAISELKQARRYATTKRFPMLQTKVYSELERVFEDSGQEDSSAVCKRKLQMLQEKVLASKQDVELLKTKTEHELLQIQNDINTVQQQKVSKRSWTWLVILIVALIAVIALLIIGRKRFRVRIHRRIARQHEQIRINNDSKRLNQMASGLKKNGLLEENGSAGSLVDEDSWNAFREKFASVHPDFFANLNKAMGRNATPAYEKVAALIYLGMNNSEIGKVLKINKDSVGRTKRRIRELVGCQTQEELSDIISKLG